MKKQALFLMAGGILAFASCNTTPQSGASDAQVDSMVNARVDQIRLEMMAQNDSLINAMALIKADSIIAAMKGGTTVKAPAKKAPAPKPTPPIIQKPTTPVNPKEGKLHGQGTSTPDKKEARFNEEAAKKQQEANTKKKEDRFK